MLKTPIFFAIFFLITVCWLNPATASEGSDENRLLAMVKKMELAFKALQDYTCEVEQTLYEQGTESQPHRFKFYYERDYRIRVDFSSPYPSMTVLYRKEEKEAIVIPFRFFPAVRFHLSIDNPRLRSIAGQRIDQAHMGHFIDFLLKNLGKVVQKEDEFHEEGDQIKFGLWAMDYIEEKKLEKYRISVSTKHWLPVRIERYSREGVPLETTVIRNYTIDTHVAEKVFAP